MRTFTIDPANTASKLGGPATCPSDSPELTGSLDRMIPHVRPLQGKTFADCRTPRALPWAGTLLPLRGKIPAATPLPFCPNGGINKSAQGNALGYRKTFENIATRCHSFVVDFLS
jgi:hypothetical protein